MREVLGGGSGGRWYADGEDTIHVVPDSRNIPVEFAEARWPFVVERLGLAVDSGGPGRHRGGLGLRQAHPDAARLQLHVHRGPFGARLLGRARRPGRPAVQRGRRPGRPERAHGRRAGRRRAGAGRRGHPDPHHRRRRLGRPAGPAVRRGAARRRLGQGVGRGRLGRLRRRGASTARSTRRRPRPSGPPRRDARTGDEPFFDRGPGYAALSGGAHPRRGRLRYERCASDRVGRQRDDGAGRPGPAGGPDRRHRPGGRADRRRGRAGRRGRADPRQRAAGRQPAGEERTGRLGGAAGAAGLVRRADPGHDRRDAAQRGRARRSPRAGCDRAGGGAGHPDPGRPGRPALRRAEQADRPVPAGGRGAGDDRARPGVAGPRRARAGGGWSPRRSRWRSSTPRRSPRCWRPASWWWPPAAAASRWCATPTAPCAGSRRSSTRTCRPRCSAGPIGADVLVIATDVPAVSRRLRHAPTSGALGAVAVARAARATGRGPLREWFDGAEGGRRVPVRRGGRRAGGHHLAGDHRRGGRRPRRHRRHRREGRRRARAHRSPQGADPARLRRVRPGRADRRRASSRPTG